MLALYPMGNKRHRYSFDLFDESPLECPMLGTSWSEFEEAEFELEQLSGVFDDFMLSFQSVKNCIANCLHVAMHTSCCIVLQSFKFTVVASPAT